MLPTRGVAQKHPRSAITSRPANFNCGAASVSPNAAGVLHNSGWKARVLVAFSALCKCLCAGADIGNWSLRGAGNAHTMFWRNQMSPHSAGRPCNDALKPAACTQVQ